MPDTVVHSCRNNTQEVIPHCPNCDVELKGWSSPSECTFTQGCIVGIIILLMLGNTVFGLGGIFQAIDSRYPNDCGQWFSKRWHYVLPSYQVSCRAVHWLKNDEDFKEGFDR